MADKILRTITSDGSLMASAIDSTKIVSTAASRFDKNLLCRFGASPDWRFFNGRHAEER